VFFSISNLVITKADNYTRDKCNRKLGERIILKKVAVAWRARAKYP
jgi:hypothetical protein